MRVQLRVARQAKSWSQYEMARRLGISRSFYSMIECRHRNPTLGLADRISKLLGVDLHTLFLADPDHSS